MSGWQPPQRPPPGARVPPPPPAPPSKAFAIRTPHPLQAYPTTAHTQYAPGARPTQSQPPVTPPTTSRYFTGPTTRVFAPAVQAPSQQPLAHAPVVIQPAAVHVPPPPQLKAMFFSSQRASHLRALLHHAEKPAHGGSGSASSSLFRLPQIGLYELFTVKASSNLMPDLLATGLTSVAFVLITEKELEKEATRFAVVQRCQQIRKQHKHLYVLYLKDGDKSTRMDELRKSNDLPTVLTCSSYDFMVQCIGIVTRVVGSEPIQRTYPAPAAQAIAYGTAQAHQATDNSRASYAMVE